MSRRIRRPPPSTHVILTHNPSRAPKHSRARAATVKIPSRLSQLTTMPPESTTPASSSMSASAAPTPSILLLLSTPTVSTYLAERIAELWRAPGRERHDVTWPARRTSKQTAPTQKRAYRTRRASGRC
ncbi:hypothetical protein C8J57DRAFT_1494129 [Mycena rebaudengoi]|nr:hypothetical protein C8J57DRAFT_1494129 [Mycena rebaudengoi]